jgi:acyl transferase domain-containing protein
VVEAVRFAAARLPEHGRPLGIAEEHWREPIAIIGMHGRFPGSRTLAQHWENLAACRDCVGPLPDDRAGNEAGVAEAGFLGEVDAFDASFFGISADEARLMDPLQRLALESAWHCVEDAGYRAADLARTETGVFFATGKSDYEELLYRNDIVADAALATGVATSIIANRVSFALGLTGPSLAIDSACSGSLAALHTAAQSIRNGDCITALVGAVNLILSPTLSQSLRKEGTLSTDCRTRSFDAAGSGYARGEGAVSLLLKKRSQAEADGDHIHGLLIGSAISHGGRANWLTAPNAVGQKQLIATAWRRAGVDPRTVTYIEAHGTGTPLGDPIEFNAIRGAYDELAKGQDGNEELHRCSIGSVKANIGHLEAAAGLAGIVKVLLSMRHASIPGNPHLRIVNPLCKTQGTPFHFAQTTEAWQRLRDADGHLLPYRAAISAFGFGGAYAHVVIEEHVRAKKRDTVDAEAAPVLPVLPISAKGTERLRHYAEELRLFVQDHLDGSTTQAGSETDISSGLEDFLYTFQVGRALLPSRVAIVARDWRGLAASLANFVAGQDDPDVIASADAAQPEPTPKDELEALSLRFARQWVGGAKVDFAALSAPGQRQRVAAPGYPFARTRFWFTDREAPAARLQAAGS